MMRGPRTATAACCSTSSWAICAPRRAVAGPAHVTTWAALTNRTSAPLPAETASGEDIRHPGKPERRLRFAATRVVTRVAVDRLIPPKVPPVEIGREIG